MAKKSITPTYDEQKNPAFFARDYWLNSQLSTARFYGCCIYNGVRYEVDELSEDLCREDVAYSRRLAYTEEDKAIIRAKHLSESKKG